MTVQSDLLTIVTSPATPDSPSITGSSHDADHYTPTGRELIPTRAIVSVTDPPFDFRRSRPIGDVDMSHDINLYCVVLKGDFTARCAAPAGHDIAMEVAVHGADVRRVNAFLSRTSDDEAGSYIADDSECST